MSLNENSIWLSSLTLSVFLPAIVLFAIPFLDSETPNPDNWYQREDDLFPTLLSNPLPIDSLKFLSELTFLLLSSGFFLDSFLPNSKYFFYTYLQVSTR